MVRAQDLQFEGPEFNSRSNCSLDLFTVVPSSNPRPRFSLASICFIVESLRQAFLQSQVNNFN